MVHVILSKFEILFEVMTGNEYNMKGILLYSTKGIQKRALDSDIPGVKMVHIHDVTLTLQCDHDLTV